MLTKLQTISPFLWFDRQAEEAAKFYVSVFPNSSITTTTRYTAAGPGPEGSVMTVAFELDGQQFTLSTEVRFSNLQRQSRLS